MSNMGRKKDIGSKIVSFGGKKRKSVSELTSHVGTKESFSKLVVSGREKEGSNSYPHVLQRIYRVPYIDTGTKESAVRTRDYNHVIV